MQIINALKVFLNQVLTIAILPIIAIVISSILVMNYIAPNFTVIATWNEDKWKIKEGRQVKLDIIETKNNKPLAILTVTNDGKKQDDNVRIQIKVSNNKIKTDHLPIKKYNAPLLEECVIKEKGCFNCDEFLEVFEKFPTYSSVEYTIYLQNFIEHRKDFKPSILSDSRNYSDNIEYREPYKVKESIKESIIDYFSLVTSNQAYANDGGDNADPKYYIGGYDPIKISKGIINLLREKNC